MNRLQALLQGMLVLALSIALPTGAFASPNISNIASVAYQDAAANNYTGQSNSGTPVIVVTPAGITSATSSMADVGVAFNYQITADKGSITSYGATGLSGTGLSLNAASGMISGTPTSPGSITVGLSATNAAGPGPTTTLTITVRGAATIVLTKSASPVNATSGTTVTFTIAYQNTGTGPASNVVITDAIPAGSTFKAGSITGGGTFSAGTIAWTIAAVNPGAPVNLTFQVTVN